MLNIFLNKRENKKQIGELMNTILMYGRSEVDHCKSSVKFEFNNK